MSVLSTNLKKKAWAFEMACGWNGRLWINGISVGKTLCLANIIQKSDLYHGTQELESLIQSHIADYYANVAALDDAMAVAAVAKKNNESVEKMDLDDNAAENDDQDNDDDALIES